MSRMRQTHVLSLGALILPALLAIVPGHVFARGGSPEVPENARAIEFGDGWKCNQGYRAVDGACTAVKLPANAYLTNTSYGNGWECVRGYREVNGGCAAVRVPAHAYATNSPFGNGWRCGRGAWNRK